MISRRKLIRIAAPAIIGIAAVPKLARAMQIPLGWDNPFAFPAGRSSSFDPLHIAAQNTMLSGVCIGGNFTNLLNGTVGALGGGANAPTPVTSGGIGPSMHFLNNGNISFPYPSVAWTSATMAAILSFDSQAATNVREILCYSAGATEGLLINMNTSGSTTSGWSFQVASNAIVGINGGLQGAAVIPNAPYFFAVSISNGLPANTVLTRLDTGQFTTVQVANTNTLGAGDTSIYIGNRGLNTRQTIGSIAAVMHTTSYLSLATLAQWSQSPWDFWYPPSMLMAELKGGAAAAGTNHLLPLLGVGR